MALPLIHLGILSTKWSKVEKGVGREYWIQAPRIRRIGVKDILGLLEEDT